MGFSMPTAKIPWGPGQLREVSKRICSETGLPGSTSWNITTPRLAEELLQEGAADLVMWPTHSRESALALYRCKRIRSFRPHLPPPDGLRPLACRITLNNECRNGPSHLEKGLRRRARTENGLSSPFFKTTLTHLKSFRPYDYRSPRRVALNGFVGPASGHRPSQLDLLRKGNGESVCLRLLVG